MTPANSRWTSFRQKTILPHNKFQNQIRYVCDIMYVLGEVLLLGGILANPMVTSSHWYPFTPVSGGWHIECLRKQCNDTIEKASFWTARSKGKHTTHPPLPVIYPTKYCVPRSTMEFSTEWRIWHTVTYSYHTVVTHSYHTQVCLRFCFLPLSAVSFKRLQSKSHPDISVWQDWWFVLLTWISFRSGLVLRSVKTGWTWVVYGTR